MTSPKCKVKFPFVRSSYTAFDGEAPYEADCWAPGVTYQVRYPDDSYAVAHGEGFMVLTEISRHKPGKFPERVFFTRKFIDPDGKEFGKGNLHIASVRKFNRLCSGYGFEYELDTEYLTDSAPQKLESPA